MPPIAMTNQHAMTNHDDNDSCSDHIGRVISKKKSHLPRSRERKVSFMDMVQYQPVLHIDDYTTKEKNATWYNALDYKFIESSIDDVISLVTTSDDAVPLSNDECLRGLENKVNSVTMNKKKNKNSIESIKAVLDEQGRQEKCQAKDDEWLADVYMMYTSSASDAARCIGHIDHVEAIQ